MAKKRLPPNVQVHRTNGKLDRYRARIFVSGKAKVGALRNTPAEAYADLDSLRARFAKLVMHGAGPSIKEAGDRRRAKLVLDGNREETLKGTHDSYMSHLLRSYGEDTPLAFLDEDEILRWVNDVRKRGTRDMYGRLRTRSPNTILGKDLTLIDRLYAVCGIISPVPAVRERIKGTVKKRYHIPKRFTIEETARFLERVEKEQFPGRRIPRRQTHFDMFLLSAVTGMRAGELARVEHQQVDLERLEILSPSEKSDSRVLAIPDLALESARRLVESAKTSGSAWIVPGASERQRMTFLGGMCVEWAKILGYEGGFGGLRAFRHTMATETQSRGIMTTASASAQLGHKNLKTTSRYTNPDPRSDTSRASVNQWAELVAARGGPS